MKKNRRIEENRTPNFLTVNETPRYRACLFDAAVKARVYTYSGGFEVLRYAESGMVIRRTVPTNTCSSDIMSWIVV